MRPSPTRGINPWRAAKGKDFQPGIVGQRRQARSLRRGVDLDQRVFGEGHAGFFRLGQIETAGGDGL